MSISITFVPEHFNAPFQYALQEHLLPCPVNFIEDPRGTGSMCRKLLEKKVDLAVVLTEGAARFQKEHPQIKVLSNFVTTSLRWGIHVRENSNYESISDLADKTFAISREGSGSHLMVKLLAQQYHFDFSSVHFYEAGGIDALVQALKDQKADVFLWEQFTTKPFLEPNQLKSIGILETPWPCFQIITLNSLWQEKPELKIICHRLLEVNQKFNENSELAKTAIQKFYPMNEQDLNSWLEKIRWATEFKPVDFEAYGLPLNYR